MHHTLKCVSGLPLGMHTTKLTHAPSIVSKLEASPNGTWACGGGKGPAAEYTMMGPGIQRQGGRARGNERKHGEGQLNNVVAGQHILTTGWGAGPRPGGRCRGRPPLQAGAGHQARLESNARHQGGSYGSFATPPEP